MGLILESGGPRAVMENEPAAGGPPCLGKIMFSPQGSRGLDEFVMNFRRLEREPVRSDREPHGRRHVVHSPAWTPADGALAPGADPGEIPRPVGNLRQGEGRQDARHGPPAPLPRAPQRGQREWRFEKTALKLAALSSGDHRPIA